MSRIVLAITFPARYYVYLTTAPRDRVAAAPLEPVTAVRDRLAA